ncbi:hypothetical protein JQ557_03145 [Bradyrhizobium sp. U87765 SZCCT0131]|nr:hypothetical protein [Bradyrhizobium sp. U87765 SZCCT0131]MBR1259274.1 hypothetical protein [Bradyrhizobium sp. U87765 SZCCT0134]MBR1305415.1 hypothetical protein [Bradyrhizobium sp. U87765 SZCCT0110]MBR1321201.1 hypothetical protein [Bradyrhizobium sp. U87765 SZCCT0109]MBR1350145.1 hypothetical protein [Bradyrhizobium sp. U87765 SZCCT0048]
MRTVALGITGGAVLLMGVLALGPASAQSASRDGVTSATGEDLAPPVVRRRPQTRLRVYRSSLGPNAKRQCVAHYEQEHRVAGTVIVPRMQCWWEPG